MKKHKISKRAKKLLTMAGVDMLRDPTLYNQAEPRIPSCGSPGCIFGFVASQSRRLQNNPRIYGQGSINLVATCNALGLSYEDEIGVVGSSRLFYKEGWPQEWKDLFWIAKGPMEEAVVAVGRIRHFMKYGE